MKKAIYLAAQAWRQAYGQVATQRVEPDQLSLLFKLPSGETLVLEGWHEVKRDDGRVYISPDGQEFDSLQYAAEAFQLECRGTQNSQGATLRAMTKLLKELQEGHAHEPLPVSTAAGESDGPSGVAQVAGQVGHATAFVFSQLDDWLHRGNHPIVKHMSLYV